MYQPNRIGPWPIRDLDVDNPAWPAEWETSLSGASHDADEKLPQVKDSIVRDNHSEVTWSHKGVTSLPANKCFSIGACVNGEAINGLSPLFSLSVAYCSPITSGFCGLTVWYGRNSLNQASDGRGRSNPLQTWTNVASGSVRHVYYNGSFIMQDEDADGFGVNPVFAGLTIMNPSASALDLPMMQVTVSLHRHATQLQIFDPKR